MVLAADYPFLDVFWTMIIFFAWVAWIWMMVFLLTDIFRRQDIGGWAKAGWCVFLIVLPFIGVLAYLITQHDKMVDRSMQQMQRQERQFDERVRSVNGGDGTAGEIEKAEGLLARGVITQDEFETLKAKAFATR
jgi:hypothetical protein